MQQELIPYAREVIDVPVVDELSESFLAYSLSVITSRAIPDIRDGLKPVQRRILYSMLQMGLRPNTPHRKSARVVGDTMGRYHPHGDSAIYETLARMGQDFSRAITLVDPQGNFGSLDDPPAAARYTECRLTEAAMELVRELDEDTVEFRPTYDGDGEEPVCLPALLPNLLVNGTTGIAVGMATNMPTHNLGEVYRAIELVLTKRRPRPTIDELLAVLPGPDFPGGGIIIDDGLAEAYTTGRGSIRIRARAEVVHLARGRQGIVITELPFQVGPERVIVKIKELVADGRLPGVAEFLNLSDKLGLRIQVECKPGVNPQALLAELYRLTPLEETFGINNVVLVGGVPTTVGLYELCQHYIDHRLEVIVRRSTHRRTRAESRLHIVEGLLIALDAIDEVVAIIRSSQDTGQARSRLIERFGLSEIQATHILDMPLRRLTALAKLELDEERGELQRAIDDFTALLGSENRQRKLVSTELSELVTKYGRPRRSRIVAADDVLELAGPVLAPAVEAPRTDEACVVTLSASGQVGRVPLEGSKRSAPGRHDLLVTSIVTSTGSELAALTTDARVLRATVGELAEGDGRSRGSVAAQVFGTTKGESVLAVVADGSEPIVLVTAGGIVKRVTATEVAGTRSGRTIAARRDGDRLVAAFACPEGIDVILVSSDGQALRTPSDGISVQGRSAGGVAGMSLREGASVVGAGPALGDPMVIAIGSRGTAKVTEAAEIPAKGRGAQGVRLARFGDGERVTMAYVGGAGGLWALMGTDDDPTKPDPTPVPFMMAATKRDLVAVATERQVLALGPGRW